MIIFVIDTIIINLWGGYFNIYIYIKCFILNIVYIFYIMYYVLFFFFK